NTTVRPNTNFNILRSQESSAHSNYNGLTFTVGRRYASHFQFQSSYTLGYNKDDDSNERNFSGITYEDPYNLAQEYNWSRNDIRPRAVASGVVDIPMGLQVADSMIYRSGLPFSPFTGVDSNGDAQFTDKPIIGGKLLERNSYRQPNYFNVDMRVSKSF